jgi:hypothetical protein
MVVTTVVIAYVLMVLLIHQDLVHVMQNVALINIAMVVQVHMDIVGMH